MRNPRYEIGPEFVELYKREFEVSEDEDFEDKNALYSM